MRRGKHRMGWGLLLSGFFFTAAALAANPPTGSPPAAKSPAAKAAVRPPAAAGGFARDIQPLLAARCVACHGPKVQKSGLRLDNRTHAFQGGDGGPALVPGKSAESELIRRVTSTDPAKVMPPGGKPLAPEQVARLREWIDQGAEWPDDGKPVEVVGRDHWAFQPVVARPAPKVKQTAWVRNPIDAFILAKLEQKGIKPSPEADRVTLIRRVSLDLLGLPPSVEEVDAFLQDRRPGAYERLVDRLLASPHYGERWARRWLDGARYADSNGYSIDSARSIWKYRDWVIQALNRDLPFDQFTIEQIAGDLLPNAAPEQVVATGFHRNTPINEEGGTDKEQFRVESVVDRVNTTGSVFLGLTVGCAQCHTHKYDPITQKEYYQLYAFLNNADEPTLPFPSPEQTRRQAELKNQIAGVEQALKDYDKNADAHRAEWERQALRTASGAWTVLDPVEFRSQGGATLQELDDRSLLVGGAIPDNDVYTVVTDLPMHGITAVRLEALTHDSLPKRGPGLAGGNFLLTDFSVASAPAEAGGGPVALDAAVADHSQKDYPVSLAIDGKAGTGWAINVAAGQGSLNTDRTAVFFLKPNPGARTGSRLVFTLKHEHANKRYHLGRFRLSVSTAPRSELEVVVPAAVRDLLAIPAAQRTPAQWEQISAEFRRSDPGRARLTARVAELQAEEKALAKAIPTTLVMRELEKPRVTHVQIRGDFLRLGAQVQPGVPAVLPQLSASVKNPNRLDLARWLVDPKNPLTPRVTVNRIWQAYFGLGLVETDDDFGKQGSAPTHPELLDWLAARFTGISGSKFQVSGSSNPKPWSLKDLHRLIVTSATYRQSSHARPELKAIDPRNRLLARQSRLRLEAEAIRDVSLAASGLLARKIGGPSVFPPQPGSLDLFTQSKKNWVASQGEDRYRRGMYTFFWRSSPHPMLTAFDAPTATVACTRRNRSNTPVGALMLANDQSLLEMAQGLAARAMKEVATGEAERLRWMFRRCLSREPTALEARRLQDYHQAQVRQFQAAPKDAERVAPPASVGGRPEGAPLEHAAALTAVARVLMNLDEFITRE